MVELNEKALDAAEVAWRASVSATCKLMLRDAIRVYLSALPAHDDGLVGRLRDGAEQLQEYVAEVGPWPNVYKHCAIALQSKDEQIERLSVQLEASALVGVELSSRLESAEQQVQKLTAENERLREALNLIDALDPEEHIYGVSHDACRGLIIRMGQVARSALEIPESEG